VPAGVCAGVWMGWQVERKKNPKQFAWLLNWYFIDIVPVFLIQLAVVPSVEWDILVRHK
jgi:hypothetical protein